ncbi:hypothetical protein EDF56_102423 [Novosphingobium sp. PhB165]|uniref:hypothetical protein n=1 Tax=Novosphingobium sp. PhB165 TaxID=2485105 RepID=UPI001046B0F9|nr:hypothetical protein [Novosphingobium sp. PhB165]TCM20760.1 hypothetical protein EDF56_102423 [Novosphingobium sp. PhB165]
MRIDARNLLDRLGRSDFAYREFEDRFTDLELWPILESLLRDPRLQALDPGTPQGNGPGASSPAAERAQPSITPHPGTLSGTSASPLTKPAEEPLKVLFSRYEQGAQPALPAEEAPAPPPPQDIRGLLRRLSQSGGDARGKPGEQGEN